MTLVTGILLLGSGGFRGDLLVAANVGSLGGDPAADPIFHIQAPAERREWTGIVIHHLGLPAADAEQVHRMHLAYGYQGLGYHFLIGNGSGLGDGVIHVGYRWSQQLPGAHVARSAPDSEQHNLHSIGICLIGNGDRRPFSERQMRSLISLVRSLQKECGIPSSAVYLHRDLAPGVTSPGRFFAATRLEEQLIP